MFAKFFKYACFVSAFLLAGTAMAETEMTMQSLYLPNQTQQKEIVIPWAEDIKSATKGEVVINVFPNRSITKDTISAIKNGSLDIGGYTPSTFAKDNPYGTLLSLPGLLKDAKHGAAMSYALYERVPEFKAEVEAIGVPLAMWSATHVAMTSVNEPIRTPDDVKGKKILTLSPAFSTIIKAWGGVPVVVSSSDVYMGLQRGMGDAILCALPAQAGMKTMEVTKYLTLLPASLSSNIFTMNRDTWNELSDEERAYISSVSGRKLADRLANSLVADAEKVLQRFRDAGVQEVVLTPEELQKFIDLAKQTIETDWAKIEIKGHDTREVIDMYYKLAAEVEGK